MKKGYKRLLIFETFLLILIIINSFVWNILKDYNMVIFLGISIFIFKIFFGLEKDRHRYVKDIIFEIITILLISLVVYYLFGLLIGFYRVENYYSLYGIKNFILPIILFVLLKEYLRYQLLTKSEGNKLLIISTVVLFIFVDISNSIFYGNFSSLYNIFIFSALNIIPAISRNIVCTYISNKLGYKPNVIWLLAINLYVYLLPILPNPNEYLLSIIKFIFPFVIANKVYLFFLKEKDKEIERDYMKTNKVPILLSIVGMIIIVYFTSGYFSYVVLAIASNSMNPNIYKGDVVIVKKVNDNYDKLKKDDIIAYEYGDVIVVHRIEKIIEKDDKYYFYTKGDANKNIDNYAVHEDMIVGIVNYKIPYLGLPTIWLNNQ